LPNTLSLILNRHCANRQSRARIVPLLSLTVSPSFGIFVALFSGINGIIGVGCIFLVLLKKPEVP